MRIDPQIRDLILPLTEKEKSDLEADITAHGCLSPLIVWEEEDVLLDGHHRHEICNRLGYTYQTTKLSFSSRLKAEIWIITNQLGRRNLESIQRCVLVIEQLEPRLAEEARMALANAQVLGGKKAGRSEANLPQSEEVAFSKKRELTTRQKCAALAGVGEGTYAKAKEIVIKRPEVVADIISGKSSIDKEAQAIKRERKEQERQNQREENLEIIATAPSFDSLSGVFSAIMVDPPWDWGDEGDVDQMGRARPDYATMSIDEIAQLDIGGKAAQDSHLYLWVTNRSLPKGFALLEKWGFRYVTCLTWVKPSFGMGNYFRGQSEQILFGARGSLPLQRKDAGTVIQAPRGPQRKHSSKPVEIYPFIESCSPGPYLEVFARAQRPGWTSWGGEA